MGCLASKEDGNEVAQPQTFSWDRDDRPDPKQYTISDQDGVECGRRPGTINGQQFIIENCKNSKIYLFDYCGMVTIDNCENCVIFIGPCKGSVFFRDSKNCKCLVACQQLRTRDCHSLEMYLFCTTQPIIETSGNIKFGCFQCNYGELESQFEKAGLSIYNNSWSMIHDFSPQQDSNNWSLLSNVDAIESAISHPSSDEFKDIHVRYALNDSLVPLTKGKLPHRFQQSCLLVFFIDVRSQAKKFLERLSQETSEYDIKQSKEIVMSSDDASRVFKSDSYNHLVENGPVIAFELNGENIIMATEKVINEIGINLSDVFISKNANTANNDVDAFYNFVDMSLN